jgi:nucleoside phosphorylase
MLFTFQSIRFYLLVGIGGGVPNELADIRLGDVVVSNPTATFGGVVQYDYGKTVRNGVFERTGMLNKVPEVLLTASSNLQAMNMMGLNRISINLANIMNKHPVLRSTHSYPGPEKISSLRQPTIMSGLETHAVIVTPQNWLRGHHLLRQIQISTTA